MGASCVEQACTCDAAYMQAAAAPLNIDNPPDGAVKPIKHLSQAGLHPLQLQRLLLCTLLLSLLREKSGGGLCLSACKRHKGGSLSTRHLHHSE